MADVPGQVRLAKVWPTTTTGAVSIRSSSVNVRPRGAECPSSRSTPGVTVRGSPTDCVSRPRRPGPRAATMNQGRSVLSRDGRRASDRFGRHGTSEAHRAHAYRTVALSSGRPSAPMARGPRSRRGDRPRTQHRDASGWRRFDTATPRTVRMMTAMAISPTTRKGASGGSVASGAVRPPPEASARAATPQRQQRHSAHRAVTTCLRPRCR